MNRFEVIVLAGDRGVDDPLAARAAVAGKSLVPLAGRSLLEHVLVCLSDWPKLSGMTLVAPESEDYRAAAARAGWSVDQLRWVEPASSPSESVGRALEGLDASQPVLLTTADHPLLKATWLDEFIGQAAGEADLAVGLVDLALFRASYPDARRTSYRFSDRSPCGCNLFLLRTQRARRVVSLWRQVEQDRKRPWRVVSLLGWATLGRYLLGSLSVDQAFKRLSARLQTTIAPVWLSDPDCAIDVDTPEDLALVERIMAVRQC